MEATQVPTIELPKGFNDKNGTPLSTGDRVHVTGSDRFGEGDGTVIGGIRTEDFRLVPDGEIRQAHEKPVRIRILMDNGTDGDRYSASAGRVEKIEGDAE